MYLPQHKELKTRTNPSEQQIWIALDIALYWGGHSYQATPHSRYETQYLQKKYRGAFAAIYFCRDSSQSPSCPNSSPLCAFCQIVF